MFDFSGILRDGTMNDKLVFPTPDTINKITPCEDWSREDRKMKLCTKQSRFNIIQRDLLVNKRSRSHESKEIKMVDKLTYIPKDDTQNYPICSLQLLSWYSNNKSTNQSCQANE